MKTRSKYLIALFGVLILILIGNLVFLGGMKMPDSPMLTSEEKHYIARFNRTHCINLEWEHSFEAIENRSKSLELRVFIRSRSSCLFLEGLNDDAFKSFMDKLNLEVQRVVNFKEAYFSIKFLCVANSGDLLERRPFYRVP